MVGRERSSSAGEEGFTLVEMVVALALAGLVFTTAAAALASSLGTALLARQNQGAIDVISQEVESVRNIGYDAVANSSSDLPASDGDLTFVDGVAHFNPGTGSEKVVAVAAGSGVVRTRTVALSSTRYTVKSFVTDPNDTSGDYRRLTVIARWTKAGVTHNRKTSTFITRARRGLPLPRFRFQAATTVTAFTAPDGFRHAYLPMRIINRGARDAWDLTLSAPTQPAWATVTYYRDDNRNGIKDGTENTPFANTTGNANPDTGLLETDAQSYFIADVLIPLPFTGPVEVRVTATSAAQPTASSASLTLKHTVNSA